MRLSYDPAKNARNVTERGLPFDLVRDLEWDSAIADEDARRDYGERRLRVMGFIGARLHVAVVTVRDEALHIISLRKANEREKRSYAARRARPGDPVG